MKKKRKNLLVVVMVLSLLVPILASCGKNHTIPTASTSEANTQTNQSIKFDKPLEFTILYNEMPNYPYKEDWLLWSKIKELTNVTLKPIVVPYADYIQKRSILISSGEAPQIMPKTYPWQEVQFIPSGAILPISDYANKLPNYMKAIKDWNLHADINTIKQKDDKYYILPGLHEQYNMDYALIYRADIFKKNSIKIPTSYDELYTALKKLKELYPNSYPMSERQNINIVLNTAAPCFGTDWGWNTGNGMMYDQSKDSFIFSPVTNEYKSLLTYLSKLVKEGLLDPESLTQSDEIAYQKFINGKTFVMGGNSQDITINLKKSMDSTLGANNYEIVKLPQLAGPKGLVLKGSRLENGIMFSSKVKDDPNFDKMLKFVDWLWYSDEGKTFTKWGVEGITYKVENGKYQLMPDITFTSLNPSGTKDLRKDFGFSNGVFCYGGRKELEHSMMSDSDLAFLVGTAKHAKQLPPDPPVLMTDGEREQSTLVSKPLMDYVKQMTYKFILGNSNIDTDWDKYIAACKAKGSDKLQDMTNKVYNTTKASLK